MRSVICASVTVSTLAPELSISPNPACSSNVAVRDQNLTQAATRRVLRDKRQLSNRSQCMRLRVCPRDSQIQRRIGARRAKARPQREDEWFAILIAERTGLPLRMERHCRHADRDRLVPIWIPARWRNRHCGVSVVTAQGAVATERILKCRTAKHRIRPSLRAPRTA